MAAGRSTSSRSGGASAAAIRSTAALRVDDGRLVIAGAALARRHRLSIGTIIERRVDAAALLSGGALGTVEESFVSRLRPGERFLFAGACSSWCACAT